MIGDEKKYEYLIRAIDSLNQSRGLPTSREYPPGAFSPQPVLMPPAQAAPNVVPMDTARMIREDRPLTQQEQMELLRRTQQKDSAAPQPKTKKKVKKKKAGANGMSQQEVIQAMPVEEYPMPLINQDWWISGIG